MKPNSLIQRRMAAVFHARDRQGRRRWLRRQVEDCAAVLVLFECGGNFGELAPETRVLVGDFLARVANANVGDDVARYLQHFPLPKDLLSELGTTLTDVRVDNEATSGRAGTAFLGGTAGRSLPQRNAPGNAMFAPWRLSR